MIEEEEVMSLDDAIKHCNLHGFELIQTVDQKQIGREYLQISKWLSELKRFRKLHPNMKLVDNIDDLI